MCLLRTILEKVPLGQRYGYQENDKNKDKTGQNRARDRKERENTSSTVPSDFIGPALMRNVIKGWKWLRRDKAIQQATWKHFIDGSKLFNLAIRVI
ncbi:hypothetical protein Tco_0728621 [Tanacetum coccineum]|uniref:Uncharacterized protein n=1 Tax=Tanacetum coccineum TaxID=301880 RepID=A0ABQ4YMI5_9ASTR